MKILGLGHYSRVGKDEIANQIVQLSEERLPGTRVKKLPFAWKLKDVCHQLYGWDGLREAEFYDTDEGAPYRDIKLPKIGMTPVELWVGVGHGLRLHAHPETWVDYVLRKDHDCDILVIPDVRYPNEVEAIRYLGGIVVKVVRPGYGPRDTPADLALWGWDGWDYVVGGGAIPELRSWAEKLFLQLTVCKPYVQSQEYRKTLLEMENDNNVPRISNAQRQLAV